MFKVLLGLFFYLGMVLFFRKKLKVTNEKINYIIVLFFAFTFVAIRSNGLGSKPKLKSKDTKKNKLQLFCGKR
jgi:hypothetical protein